VPLSDSGMLPSRFYHLTSEIDCWHLCYRGRH